MKWIKRSFVAATAAGLRLLVAHKLIQSLLVAAALLLNLTVIRRAYTSILLSAQTEMPAANFATFLVQLADALREEKGPELA